MKCPECGTLLKEDSKFCISCGASLDKILETVPVAPSLVMSSNSSDQQETKRPNFLDLKKSKNDKQRMLGLSVGTLIIVTGVIRIITAGTSISSTSFGGDFYTYTYQGIVAISEILASIEVSLGWIIVAIGAAINLYAFHH